MSVQENDETGLTNNVDYYFKYNIDDIGFVESSINPDLGDASPEETSVEAVADVSGSLESTYFNINSTTVDYYIWMNKFVGERFDVIEETTVVFANTLTVTSDLRGKYWTLNSAKDVTEYYIWYNQRTPPTDSKKQIINVNPAYTEVTDFNAEYAGAELQYLRSATISDNRAIIVGRDINSSNYGTAIIYEKIVDGDLIAGSSYSWNAAYITYCDVIEIEEDKAFIIYYEAATTLKCIIATISEKSITYGSAVTIATSAGIDLAKAEVLPGTSNVAIIYNDSSHDLYTGICKVSGTTITTGTMSEVTEASTRVFNYYSTDITTLDSNKYFITTAAYLADELYYGTKSLVVEVDSTFTTVTIGKFYGDNITGSDTNGKTLHTASSCDRIDNNKVLVYDYTSSGTQSFIYIAKINGTSITYTTPVIHIDSLSSSYQTNVKVIGDRFATIAKTDTSGFLILKGSISGDNIEIEEFPYSSTIAYVDIAPLRIDGVYNGEFILTRQYSTSNTNGWMINFNKPVSGFDPGPLEGKYWYLNSTDTDYYIWYKVPDTSQVVKVTSISQGNQNGSSSTLSTSTHTSEAAISCITSTKCIGVYSDDNVLKARVGTFTPSTLALSWGTEYLDSPTYSQACNGTSCAIDSTHSVMVYSYYTGGATLEYYGMILTEASGAITYNGSPGSNTGIKTSGYGSRAESVVLLDSTHILTALQDGVSSAGKLIVGTISGTTITWGTAVSVPDLTNGATVSTISVANSSSSNAVVIWRSGSVICISTLTITGTTIEFKDSRTLHASTGSYVEIVNLSSTKYFIAYGYYETTFKTAGRVLTTSGSDFSNIGSLTVLFAGDPDYNKMVALDSNRIAFMYSSGFNQQVTIYTFYINDNETIGISQGKLFTATGSSPMIDNFDSDYVAITMLVSSNTLVYGVKPYQDTLNGTYFTIEDPTTSYYVWFDLNNTSTDPDIADATGIEVNVATSATSGTVASAIQSAINSETDFSAAVSGDLVTITNANIGTVTDIVEDGTAKIPIAIYGVGHTATTDPAPADKTGIQALIDVDPNNDIDDSLLATQTAINANSDFSASIITTKEVGVDWLAGTSAGGYSNNFNSIINTNSATRLGSQSLYVAVGDNAEIQTSFEGSLWISRTADNSYSGDFYGTAFGKNTQQSLTVILGSNAEIQTSIDCIEWDHQTKAGSFVGDFNSGTYGNDIFVIIGTSGEIQTSDYGETWAHRTNDGSFTGAFKDIVYGNSTFVAVGDSGEIQTSTDGTTWTSRTPAASFSDVFYSITYGNGLFIAVGYGGETQSSSDGITWTQEVASSGSTTVLFGISFGSDLFITVGFTNPGESDEMLILTSPDGSAWTQQPAPAVTDIFNDITYGPNGFILVGNDGDIQYSKEIIRKYIEVENATAGSATYPSDYDSGATFAIKTIGTPAASAVEDTDPAPAGKTEIKIFVEDTEEIGNNLANRNKKIINLLDDFSITNTTTSMYIDNASAGSTTDATVGTANDDLTYLSSVTITTQGDTATPEYNSPDPAPPSKTGVEVKYVENDLALTINGLLDSAIDSNPAFSTNYSTGDPFGFGWSCLSAAAMGNTYFTFDLEDGTGGIAKYYVYSGTDPELAGRTGIDLDLSGSEPVATVRIKIRDEINSVAGAHALAFGDGSRYRPYADAVNNGTVPDPVNVSVPGLFIEVTTQGTPSTSLSFNFYTTWSGYYDATEEWDRINSSYFIFDFPDGVGGTNSYYIWYNINSEGVDPNLSGRTGLEVALPDPSSTDIWYYAGVEIDGLTEATSSWETLSAGVIEFGYTMSLFGGSGGTSDDTSYAADLYSPSLAGINGTTGVEVTNVVSGIVTDATDNNTGFTITTIQQGSDAGPATTWNDIIPKLNEETVGGVWSLLNNDIRLTSDSSGATATVRLEAGSSGTNLFTALTKFTAFEDPKDPFSS